ncbi:hypothetical protein TYRP_011201 [Tyrophagus putrescentiae]|nr:hypothetical protein TYRP_011201 [Tyrophagus putrescentiae]
MDRRPASVITSTSTSATLHPMGTPSAPDHHHLKLPPSTPQLSSNWSVNFLSVARERISSLASSLATSIDGHSLGSSGSGCISNGGGGQRRRRGSWSPAEAAAYFYAAQQQKQQQQKQLGPEGLNSPNSSSFIYSIDSDLSSRSSDSSYHATTLSPSSRGGYFSRRSTQSLKVLRTADLPTLSIPILFQLARFALSPSSSPSPPPHHHHHHYQQHDSSSSSFLRSTSGFISSDYEHSYRTGGENLLDEAFTRAFGYHSLDEIELYSELHKMLESKRDGVAVSPSQDQLTDSSNNNSSSSGRRGCSKSVTRFGLGYEDHCMFPLVLPVFLNECLQKKKGTYVTWDYIKLAADAQLCQMELATLRNLSRRFDSAVLPITGAPIDNICPDPNLFIRSLCYQLVVEGSFHSMAGRERNRALKRWNSTDDLLSLSSNSGKGRLEPEFVGAKGHASRRTFTDESIGLTRTWSRVDLRASMRRKQQQQQQQQRQKQQQQQQHSSQQLSGLSSVASSSNNLLFKELSSLLGQPVKLAQYLTRFYLDQFQTGFDAQMLAQLVLLKDISSPDCSQVNRRLRTSLLNLLTFDDTVVAVVGAHFRQLSGGGGSVEQQVRALASLIETACLLRQLRNFYGLKVVIGSLQSLPVYLMTEAWRLLAYRMPVHYCDFKRLCSLSRRLEGAILGTNKPHIPTLANLLNRLRLCCTVSWDLFEARRRFVEHPSIAGWLHTEIIGGVSSSSSSSNSSFSSAQQRRRSTTSTSKASQVKFAAYPEPPLIARLSYDPISESYLTTSDPIRLINWSDFPLNWRGRYLPAIPERYLRNLLQTKSFTSMVECFFRTPIDRYQMDSV